MDTTGDSGIAGLLELIGSRIRKSTFLILACILPDAGGDRERAGKDGEGIRGRGFSRNTATPVNFRLPLNN
jgi:hypothetical protein